MVKNFDKEPRKLDGNKRRRTLRKRTMRLATWNIQGLRTKQLEVFQELKQYKIDICVFTETKKKGRGSEEIEEYMHFYSGVEKSMRARRGVSIAVHKKFRKNVKSWEEIDEQIISMEIVKNGETIVIIGAYAPSDDADANTKDEFYDKLRDVLINVNHNKEVCILGDFNARIGRKENNAIVGRYGEERVNSNGERLMDLCQILDLRIMNGFFQHKEIHKFTWVQPKKKLQSIIDYLIQPQRTRLKTNDVRVYRGAECGTDHYMVVAKITINYRKRITQDETEDDTESQPKLKKYNIDSLRDESTQFLYKMRLAAKLANVDEIEGAEEKYQTIKKCIHEAATEALGYWNKDRKDNPEWWTDDIKDIVEEKKKAYNTWLRTKDPEDRKTYTRLNRETKKIVSKKKNQLWEKKCEDVERFLGGSRVSQAWKFIKSVRQESKETGNINLIQSKKWKEYYMSLLTENRDEFLGEIDEVTAINEECMQIINKKEIKNALREMKNGKAPGPGDIPVELVKYGPDILIEMLADIFNKCLMEGQNIPEDWNLAYISSIYKKGDKKVCGNYRGISVTSSIGRLYGRILKKRIEAEYQEIEEQNGFRAGRSCMDNIFTLQQIIEKRVARNLSTHIVFIDLEKAYDNIPLKPLFNILTRTDLKKTYIRAIYNIYKNPQSLVKIKNTFSEPFRVTKGLKQGCCLSPTLFKIYIQEALQKWRRKCTDMGIKIGNNYLSTLFFADDQILIANCEEDVDYMLRKLKDEYEQVGMRMNLTKTEYLRIGKEDEDPELQLRQIRKCEEYKYLGSILSNKGSSERDIRYRVQQGQKSVRVLNSLLWSNRLSLNTKMTIYRSIVEPILTYGSESWQMTEVTKKKVDAVEMDFLRRACRVSKLEHIPNNEIRRRTNRIHRTTERIETRQLIWYGHVRRMEENRWPKKALDYTPPNKRKRGRPPATWINGVMATMRDRAIDEDAWRDKKIWRSKCGMRQKL